jgi:Ca2+/H+ antiporter, TMEM165/GDT1 family
MTAGSIFLAAFLAAGVEWVEAFTIVLAVALSIGWRRAASAALAALALLAAMTAATGGLLDLWLDSAWLEGAIGVLLLLFGVRWLAKAIARHAGLLALHDEDAELAAATRELARADRHAAWLVAFKGVLLEGLEVCLIVATLGPKGGHTLAAGSAALAALGIVAAAGALVQAPLRRVPENAVKFAVGAMITAFGTFWTLEAMGGGGAWPWGEGSLPALAVFYLAGGLVVARHLRRHSAAALVP